MDLSPKPESQNPSTLPNQKNNNPPPPPQKGGKRKPRLNPLPKNPQQKELLLHQKENGLLLLNRKTSLCLMYMSKKALKLKMMGVFKVMKIETVTWKELSVYERTMMKKM